MVKPKPSWICQNCERAFTTKYSLCRHFKRFPSHAPANLNDGSDLKPITVEIDEYNRTVQVVAMPGGAATAAGLKSSSGKGTVSFQHSHKTRHKHEKTSSSNTGGNSNGGKRLMCMSDSSSSNKKRKKKKRRTETDDTTTTTTTTPPNVTGTPIAVVTTGTSTAFHPTNATYGFPFLPSYLEDEQILDIATPQQHHYPSLLQSESTSSSSSDKKQHQFHHHHQQQYHSGTNKVAATPLSPTTAHYSWMFHKETTPVPGGDLLSPLAPACTYGHLFSDESEAHLQLQNRHNSHHNHKSSQVKKQLPIGQMHDLDQSLLLGDEEATSPFTFLTKSRSSSIEGETALCSTSTASTTITTNAMTTNSSNCMDPIMTPSKPPPSNHLLVDAVGTSLDFLSPGGYPAATTSSVSRSKMMMTTTTATAAATISLDDLDFGFAF